ncbi:hypothetical protein [Nonomuraea sp. NPDC049758]|uniref:hypothetical protein n=1 Tax=Nonomuraea sp. NPDC049758 TaxID=3154360 RepID=UPI00341505A4
MRFCRFRPTPPGGRLIFHVFAALAEFIRELIVADTRDGLAAAQSPRPHRRPPNRHHPELLRAARDMLPNPANSITSIAKLLGVSLGTLYNHSLDLRQLRDSGQTRELTSDQRSPA